MTIVACQSGKTKKELTDLIHAGTPGGEEGVAGLACCREAGAGVSGQNDRIA